MKCLSDERNSEHIELYSNMGMRMQHTIFLMMRLKSFRPEVNKSWQSRRDCKKKKKKSPINDFKTKMIS
jgi:predicted transcriptional regulator